MMPIEQLADTTGGVVWWLLDGHRHRDRLPVHYLC
jgi:hypothetical protein